MEMLAFTIEKLIQVCRSSRNRACDSIRCEPACSSEPFSVLEENVWESGTTSALALPCPCYRVERESEIAAYGAIARLMNASKDVAHW